MVEKVSDITYQKIADYIRVAVGQNDTTTQNELKTYLKIAKEYISSYTGIPITKDVGDDIKTLDDYPDFIIVVYILCQDMYDNRSMYVDDQNLNKVVQTILGMHTMNNL